MLMLTPDQAGRLSDLYHWRSRQAMARALAEAFPETAERVGERLPELISRVVRTAAGYRMTDAACAARLLACWVALGVSFETRAESAWALAMLSDERRSQSAKAFQLCRRCAEQLPAKAAPGVVDRDAFEAALAVLDRALLPVGVLGALVPSPRLRFGEPCDVDALELRMCDHEWRQEYRLLDGRWQRVDQRAEPEAWLLRADAPAAAGAPGAPARLTLLSRDLGKPAALRLRIAAQQACDGGMHPLVRCTDESGLREWRGPVATQLLLGLPAHGEPPPPAGRPAPLIAAEDSPRYVELVVDSCGVRASGLPLGRVEAWIGVYSARQYLMAWQRAPGVESEWPLQGTPPDPPPPPRCRIECDGSELPAAAWLAQLRTVDEQLAQALGKLVLPFERTSGVELGRVHAEPRVMAGTATLTWGWRDGGGVQQPPFMRAAGTLDLDACALKLSLEGVLHMAGTVGRLRVWCHGSERLKADWSREDAAVDWIAALEPAKRAFALPFEAAYTPQATDSGSLVSVAGPVQGALAGQCGLRPSRAGAGLEFFCELKLEALALPLLLHDPLLGVSEQRLLPLLPETVLLDWSLG